MQMDIVPLIISVPPFALPAGFNPMDLAEFPTLQFENKAKRVSKFSGGKYKNQVSVSDESGDSGGNEHARTRRGPRQRQDSNDSP